MSAGRRLLGAVDVAGAIGIGSLSSGSTLAVAIGDLDVSLGTQRTEVLAREQSDVLPVAGPLRFGGESARRREHDPVDGLTFDRATDLADGRGVEPVVRPVALDATR